jgi:hypothetical protein
MAHDTGRRCLFGEGACAACEQQPVLRLVFAGEEEVRAACVSAVLRARSGDSPLGAEAEQDGLLLGRPSSFCCG